MWRPREAPSAERAAWLRTGGLTAATAAIGIALSFSGALSGFEQRAFDIATRLLNPDAAPPESDVVLIKVDQRAIDQLSQQMRLNWPWPRQVYAPVVDYLRLAEAVYIDILFTEPSSRGVQDDALFAEAIRAAGNVVLPMFLRGGDEALATGARAFLQRASLPATLPVAREFGTALTPIPELRDAAAYTGNVVIRPDSDGVYRRMPLAFRFDDMVLPTFVLPPLIATELVSVHSDGLREGDSTSTLPLVDGNLLLRFYREQDPFPVYSFFDVLLAAIGQEAAPATEAFRGKHVVIGLTAAGLFDLRPTAANSVSTGMLVHATALDNLLRAEYLTLVGGAWRLLFILLVAGGTTVVVLRSHSLLINSALFLLLIAITIGLPALLFANRGYMQLTGPFTAAVVTFIAASVYSYATEGRRRREVKSTFQRYVAPAVVDSVLSRLSELKLGGEKRQLTALFSDIHGFTSISERLDAEQLVTFLNRYFNVMTRVLLNYQGTLDKFMGDAIMAFYGAPLPQADHAVRACHTAVEMMCELDAVRREWREQAAGDDEGLPDFDIGIGINSGEMTVGNMGSDERFDYTIMGDAVNLASRLEGINKEYGTNIVVSEFTLAELDGVGFITRYLDAVRVKGKTEPVTIYELMGHGVADQATGRLLQAFEEGVAAYKRRQWPVAREAFQASLAERPDDTPSQLYLGRCEAYAETPPADDWDGVFEMKTK